MGAVQRLATVVIIGLVALSTVLVLYTADENNRVDKQAEVQQDAAIERGTANFIQFCMACHGPAGEGLMENVDPKRLGLPLGGDTYATKLNQEGIQADGTPYPGGFAGRTEYLTKTIHNGKGEMMPAWGQENGGQLNDQQIIELVIMIQHVDWNKVYNEAIEVSGGYPTVPLLLLSRQNRRRGHQHRGSRPEDRHQEYLAAVVTPYDARHLVRSDHVDDPIEYRRHHPHGE